jgi:hypothetical protein
MFQGSAYIHTYITPLMGAHHALTTAEKRQHPITLPCACAYIHICTYTHTHIHTYIHTFIHTYTQTYIHTYVHVCSKKANTRTYLHTCAMRTRPRICKNRCLLHRWRLAAVLSERSAATRTTNVVSSPHRREGHAIKEFGYS